MRDDLENTLDKIVEYHESSIVQQMLALQSSAHSDKKWETWATHLQFLQVCHREANRIY